MITRRASHGLALTLALASIQAATSGSAYAKDEEERRAISMDELERQESQSTEMLEMARVKRMESIDRLRALLAQAPEGDRKAEMMLRLADLYREQGKADYFVEMEKFNKIFDQCFNQSETGDECDKLKPDHDESYGWYRKAIKLYEAVLRGYPRYARADQATFYLGMTYQETEEKEKALDAFKRLVKFYPASQWVPDAYVLIGEYYFDKNDAFPALRAYLKAASYTESDRYAYASYKLAWSYYNVEEYGKAIDTMKRVVAFSMENADQGSAIKLEEEALKDLVRFFADAGEMDEAYEYFTKLGKKDLIRAMLKRLAGLYFEQGKFEQSVATYRRLIMENPSHPDNPGYQEEIISAYRKLGDKSRVIDEIKRLRSDYGKTSAWWRTNASDPDATRNADETIEKVLRRTATDYNKEARDLRKARHPRADEAFENAVEAYYIYLEDYGEKKDAYNVHYDFGEMLYLLKRYDEAYREYMKVVEMDPQGQHSRFCAESAIFAAEEMVKKEGGGEIKARGVKVDKDVQPEPLTEWEQRLVDACAQYAKLFPKDSKVETAIYKAAFLLYQRYHFTDAANLFRDVIAMNPKSQNAEYSANLILDALKIKEEYVALRDTAKAFYEQESLGSSKFKKEMYEIWSAAAFTVIQEDFDANEDYGKTADAFVAFYEQFPDFDKVDFALNNAAAYYYKADRVADSMKVRHILVENEQFGPKTKFYFNQVGALGYDYERLANFEQATKYYDMLVGLYEDEREKLEKSKDDDKDEKLAEMDAKVADALFTSAVFHSAMGDSNGAIERYRDFIARFPADERVLDTRLTIAKILEDEGEWSEAADAFEAFYTKSEKDAAPEYTFFARLHHGRALLEQGKVSEARRLYDASVDQYEKLMKAGGEQGAHTEFVAEMMFELTKDDFDEYAEVQIKGDGSRNRRREDKAFKASLQKKSGSLLELEKSYTGIIETGAGEWGLAGIVGLGKAYENMAETLTSSPCPYYLTDDQCEIYKLQLEDKAYVQTEKAVEAYKLALEKSYELNLYNDNAAFATRRLGELRPEDFPGLREDLPTSGWTAEAARVFEVETGIE